MSLGLGGGAGKPYVIKKNQPVESLERDKMIDKENPSNEKTDGKKDLSQYFDDVEEPAIEINEIIENNKNEDESDDELEIVEGEIWEAPLTEEELSKLGSMNEVWYKTGDVAKILDITEQTVRNLSVSFEKFIGPYMEKSPSGHRRYSAQAVEYLRLILRLRQEKNLSIDQTIEFLSSDEEFPLRTLTPEKKWDVLLQLISQHVNEAVLNAVEESRTKLMDHELDMNNNYAEVIEKNNAVIEKLGQQISEKDNVIEEQNQLIETMSDTLARYEELIKTSIEANEKLLSGERELRQKSDEQIKALTEELKERSDKKKKGFLSSIFSS